MSLERAIGAMRSDPEILDNLVHWEVLPPVAARHGTWPEQIDARLVEALQRRGIDRPYVHQEAAIRHALAGRDQVIVTPTASGKTLCYSVPVLQRVLEDPSARALHLFPTKALAQDQLQELRELVAEAGIDLQPSTYDGDTAPAARRAVRRAGHVAITNPDMLHTGILPHHTKWVRLFSQLRYVVIDELHTYRGVFGSHVANVLRRLQRICRFYGSDPTFICCSATIANPGELASRLLGRPVEVVDENGAPRGERHIAFYNPPIVQRELGLRRGTLPSAVDVAARIQAAGVQTLVFARSRNEVELATQYLRERQGGGTVAGSPNQVRGYRSGYLPKERRSIESGLREGSLRTVIATNALELGIDVGGLDAVVIAGYPGTVASLWQQVGRAGRRNDPALAVVVAGSSPLDQYIVAHPEYALGDSIESGMINADNPLIAAQHLQCAAFELPIERREYDEIGSHTAELAELLEESGTVYRSPDPGGNREQDKLYWSSEAYPAEQVSLRRGPEQNVVIVEQGPPAQVIGEVDRPSAMVLVHDEAIYMHDGRQYHVDHLDWEELKAYVRPVSVDYYTDAQLAVDLKVLEEADGRREPVDHGHGEVAITYLATIFKKIKLHTHENVGWGKIRLPQDDLHTGAFWLALPERLTAAWDAHRVEAALHALGQVFLNVAPLLLMCDPRDLRLSVQVRSPHTGRPTIFLWEPTPGGLGFGEHLFREAPRLAAMALELVAACSCLEGCPGCVGPPSASGSGQRAMVLQLLRALAGGTPRESSGDAISHRPAVVGVDA